MEEHIRPASVEKNPHTAADTDDDGRADMLAAYLDTLATEFGEMPRLMPLDSEGKGPIIQDRCKLDTPEGRSYLVDGDDAVQRIREDGARGFAIYAGKERHNTEVIVLVDVDERETFPYEAFPATLMVLSGSARGEHLTYRNGGDVSNASGKNGVDGEVRARNWFCVTPGSIHPSDGVYHIHEGRRIATLHTKDIPRELRPASDRTTPTPDGSGVVGEDKSRSTPTTAANATVADYSPNEDANPLAVIKANTWIGEYLAGVTTADDRSKKDFAVCRAFARAGVSEDDVRTVLTNSPHTKASRRGQGYWAETWGNAVDAEHGVTIDG
jgi:hypothetical protein